MVSLASIVSCQSVWLFLGQCVLTLKLFLNERSYRIEVRPASNRRLHNQCQCLLNHAVPDAYRFLESLVLRGKQWAAEAVTERPNSLLEQQESGLASLEWQMVKAGTYWLVASTIAWWQ